MLLKLSGKLDSETHLRIKAFLLAASRLEAVSLAQCGEGRSFLQLFEKKVRVLLWPLLLQTASGSLGRAHKEGPTALGLCGQGRLQDPLPAGSLIYRQS